MDGADEKIPVAPMLSSSFDITITSSMTNEGAGVSTLSAIINVVVTAVGAGVMAMGQLPSRCGLLVAVLMALAAQCVVIEGGLQLSEAMHTWNALNSGLDPIRTFEDYGRAAFGQIGAVVVQIVMVGWQMGACAGYTILISTQMKQLGALYFGWDVNYRIFILVIIPLLLLSSMLKNVKALDKITPIAITASFGVVLLIIIQASVDQHWWKDWDLQKDDRDRLHDFIWKGSFLDLGTVFAIMMGGSGVTCIFPCVANEMKHPAQLNMVVIISCTCVILLYIIVIITGYLGYGNFINENVLLNMQFVPADLDEALNLEPTMWSGPKNHMGRIVGQTAAWTLIANLLFSYPVLIITIFCSIQGTECAKRIMPVGSWNNIFMRCGLVVLSAAIGCVTEKFSTIFSFAASLFLPIQGVFVPLVGAFLIKKCLGVPQVSWPRIALHALMCILGLMVLVLGLINSVKDFANQFGGESKKSASV